MPKYKILSPNKEYTGFSAGVSFINGEGITVDIWLVDWFKNMGYEVIKEEEEDTLNNLTVKELKELAKDKEIEGYSDMKKEELIKALEGVKDVKKD